MRLFSLSQLSIQPRTNPLKFGSHPASDPTLGSKKQPWEPLRGAERALHVHAADHDEAPVHDDRAVLAARVVEVRDRFPGVALRDEALRPARRVRGHNTAAHVDDAVKANLAPGQLETNTISNLPSSMAGFH